MSDGDESRTRRRHAIGRQRRTQREGCGRRLCPHPQRPALARLDVRRRRIGRRPAMGAAQGRDRRHPKPALQARVQGMDGPSSVGEGSRFANPRPPVLVPRLAQRHRPVARDPGAERARQAQPPNRDEAPLRGDASRTHESAKPNAPKKANRQGGAQAPATRMRTKMRS